MSEFVHRTVPMRSSQIVARFLHPETDAPMVTWYQISTIRDERPVFYSASEKEFHGWFRPAEGDIS